MIKHTDFANNEEGRSELRALINDGKIAFGGNMCLKIYETLKCKSGKRMKRENRVFFSSERETIDAESRPCGHCMKEKYFKWREHKNDNSTF